jgi:hypothetical protein
MLNRVRSLAAVLLLGLPSAAHAQQPKAPPPAPPQTQVAPKKLPAPPPAAPANPMGTYTYCDAKMLSVLWKGSVSDAKARIRSKVSANATAMLDGEVKRARDNAKKDANARCNWDEAGLAFTDVEKLAKLWKTTVARAKVMIEDKIIAGGEAALRAQVTTSAGAAIAAEDPTSTYLKQEKYTYCDVKILSEYWKTSASDAKARIGLKIQAGAEDYLRKEIYAGWQGTKQTCSYVDGGFTFTDVKTLAKLWSISVAESKQTIANKLKSGNSIYLKQEIRDSAGGGSDLDKAYEAFHAQTKYTYCDAHMIGKLWGKSLSDGKVAIGAKLAAKKKTALVKLVADARKNAKKKPEARCSFYDAGFSYDDAMLLGKLWKKDPSDVKSLVPEKLALGQEAALNATLKKERAKAAKAKAKAAPPPAPMPPTTSTTPATSTPGTTTTAPPATKTPSTPRNAPTPVTPPGAPGLPPPPKKK